MDQPRLALAALPTPLQRVDALRQAWGGPTLWVKRDDLTGFGVSGNKVRKLEFHMAAAQRAGADTVITCGALQSNHCRATAVVTAALGMRTIVLLRAEGRVEPEVPMGNYLISLLAGAHVRLITPSEYVERDALMAAVADEVASAGGVAWVIPEGASDALGMRGFEVAMLELHEQLAAAGVARAAVWHAGSSGGTTAGLGWAADRLELPVRIIGTSVGDSVPDLRSRIEGIWEEAMRQDGGPLPRPDLELTDDHVGLGYGQTTPEELRIQVDATRRTGLLFDPTYTGKAIAGLHADVAAGRFDPDEHVVFWHTGGGFAVFGHDYGDVLTPTSRTTSPADQA